MEVGRPLPNYKQLNQLLGAEKLGNAMAIVQGHDNDQDEENYDDNGRPQSSK